MSDATPPFPQYINSIEARRAYLEGFISGWREGQRETIAAFRQPPPPSSPSPGLEYRYPPRPKGSLMQPCGAEITNHPLPSKGNTDQ